MKRSAATLFALSTLALLLGSVQGELCFAQTQSQAGAPNAEETLRYINAANPSLYTLPSGVGATPLTISSDRTQLLMHCSDEKVGSSDLQVDIRELDPTLVRVEHNNASNDVIQIGCTQKKTCSTHRYHTPGWEPGVERYDNFYFWMTPDGDKADRVARALRHLVELLQAEYKSSHTSPVDPNDPFAKPQ
jgi:hypothetical protein